MSKKPDQVPQLRLQTHKDLGRLSTHTHRGVDLDILYTHIHRCVLQPRPFFEPYGSTLDNALEHPNACVQVFFTAILENNLTWCLNTCTTTYKQNANSYLEICASLAFLSASHLCGCHNSGTLNVFPSNLIWICTSLSAVSAFISPYPNIWCCRDDPVHVKANCG